MRAFTGLVAIVVLLAAPGVAAPQGFQDALLESFVGSWVLRGSIGGEQVVHDVGAEWVLNHYYLRFHEVSRELDSEGKPLYEAIVFIGWDAASERYACLWLDSTGGGGLDGRAIGYAEPGDETLAFIFDTLDGGVIHTTFAYSQAHDSWRWAIDVERRGNVVEFARVELTRE